MTDTDRRSIERDLLERLRIEAQGWEKDAAYSDDRVQMEWSGRVDRWLARKIKELGFEPREAKR